MKSHSRPESRVVRAIMDWAAIQPRVHLWRNVVVPSPHGPTGLGPGSPDLVGWVDQVIHGQQIARLLAVEAKRERGGRLADHQRGWLDYAARHGALCCVARSVADVEKLLEGII